MTPKYAKSKIPVATQQIIIPPVGGWKPSTNYVVEVCMNVNNPIFQDIFYTGFLTESGYPNGYNILFDANTEIKNVKYMRAIREINCDIDNTGKMLNDVLKKDFPEYLIWLIYLKIYT